MRLCCNAHNTGRIYQADGRVYPIREVDSLETYFNSPDYLDIRKKMLNGERPAQCRRCYSLEDHGGLSQRQMNLENYMKQPEFVQQVEETQADGSITPQVTYMDFALGNKCNIKCVMCNPVSSSILKPDFEKLNWGYDVNVYEGAEHGWAEEDIILKAVKLCLPTTKEILFTGGEPLLSRLHMRILEAIVEQGMADDMTITYHSNCTQLPDRLISLWSHFKAINVHASIEGYGELNDYIRYGSDFQVITANLKKMLELKNIKIEVYTCFDVLSILGLPALYTWLSFFDERIDIMPSHIWVSSPPWLQAHIIPESLKKIVRQKMDVAFRQKLALRPDYEMELKVQSAQAMVSKMETTEHDPVLWREFLRRVSDLEALRGNSLKKLLPDLFKAL